MLEPKTLARPYAAAIFEYAKQQGKLNEWLNVLALLAEVSKHPEFMLWLSSSVAMDKKTQTLMQLLGDQPEDVHNAIQLLTEKKRLDILADIYQLYNLSKQIYEQTQTVQINSAYALNDAQLKSLQTTLSKKLGRNIELVTQVDTTLIGGLVIQMGDEIYDHSIKGQLHQLSQGLLTAAA
jgi:F-type H+-transporting ATPase subunit delta